MIIRKYVDRDLPEIIRIWNEVVKEGIAFPQEELLNSKSGAEFFVAQSYTAVAEEDGKIYGLYILHPNNVGRCGHICNASYAVSSDARGRHIGEQLVLDCLKKGKELGFRVLQFNAVVESNTHDIFENIYNGKVYTDTGKKVAELIDPSDEVLECACGTGAISIYIAQKCEKLIATDFAPGMLRRAAKKCRNYPNVVFKKADITNIKCKNDRFDKVVAGNVIHLLPEPEKALRELERVVKPGGKIIIPTYINMSKGTGTAAVKFITLLGADFKRQFNLDSYKEFFEEKGYAGVRTVPLL